jgi:hypothetical protein
MNTVTKLFIFVKYRNKTCIFAEYQKQNCAYLPSYRTELCIFAKYGEQNRSYLPSRGSPRKGHRTVNIHQVWEKSVHTYFRVKGTKLFRFVKYRKKTVHVFQIMRIFFACSDGTRIQTGHNC